MRPFEPDGLVGRADGKSKSNLVKLVTINLAGLACFFICYLIGLVFRFDGQAAVLALPFVLLGYMCSIYAIVVNIRQLLRPSEKPRARIISGVILLAYGLCIYFAIPKNR